MKHKSNNRISKHKSSNMKDQRSKREKAPGGKGLRWGLGSTMLVGRLTKLKN